MLASFTSCARTDPGLVRLNNEDAFTVREDLGLIVVADGVGGEENGAETANLITRSLPELLKAPLRASRNYSLADLKSAVSGACYELHGLSRGSAQTANGRSTVVAVVLRDDGGVVAHIGDSRAYLLQAGMLRRLTKDHSLAQLLVDSGEMDEEEAGRSALRNQITKSVGMRGDPRPDLREFSWSSGDWLLLCTDGLTSMVSDAEIERALASAGSPQSACDGLIDRANARGGPDNITVVAARNDKLH